MNLRTPTRYSHEEDSPHHITTLKLGGRSGEDDLPHTESVDAVRDFQDFVDFLVDEDDGGFLV
jgi:hypothetical protein